MEIVQKINPEWRIPIALIVALLVISVISIIQHYIKIGVFLMVVAACIYLLANLNIGPISQTIYNKSVNIVTEVTGETEDEIKERGEGAINKIGEITNSIVDFIED